MLSGWVCLLDSSLVTTDDTAAPPPDEESAPSASAEQPAGKHGKKARKHLPVWQESVLLLVVALGLAIVIKALFVQAFYIPSESMEPGLVKNDRILVQKVSYWFGRTPKRGDVIVFADPGQWLTATDDKGPTGMAKALSKVGLYPTGGHLVKRVIGTEGDVVQCCDTKGRILVNGKPIDETSYLSPERGQCSAELNEFDQPCTWIIGPIPKGKLLVLGDNRLHSADSRAHICAPDEDPCTQSPWVDTDLVVGKVFALIWPRDRWRWISRPEAFADVPDHPSASLVAKAKEAHLVPGS
ncbi:hypothetical protein GCM10022237_37070 [Nocardioides ginsengisoli]